MSDLQVVTFTRAMMIIALPISHGTFIVGC